VTGQAAGRRLRRFFVPPSALGGETVLLGAPQSHHIATVLRLRPGDHVVLFDGAGEAEAELLTVRDGATTARLVSPRRPASRLTEITLLQGVARGSKMDLIVRMATEIGLSSIVPVVTARSVSDPGPSRSSRWRRIAQEAARQCGRADLPDVPEPSTLAQTLAILGPVDLLVVPWERATEPLGVMLTPTAFESAAILVGPEGGLTDDEVETARAAGGRPVSLGPLILRTETAGVVTAAMLIYERFLRGDSARRGGPS
jgi:16S rRNA (uracil1498-N3)-methyltransferase